MSYVLRHDQVPTIQELGGWAESLAHAYVVQNFAPPGSPPIDGELQWKRFADEVYNEEFLAQKAAGKLLSLTFSHEWIDPSDPRLAEARK